MTTISTRGSPLRRPRPASHPCRCEDLTLPALLAFHTAVGVPIDGYISCWMHSVARIPVATRIK